MKKIVALVLALVLVTALGATAFAEAKTFPAPVRYSKIIYEQDYDDNDFVVGSKVVEEAPAEEANPETGLHFGF